MKVNYLLLILTALTPLSAQVGGGGQMGGFGGPAVLGRGAGSGTGQRGGSDLGIGFSAGVMGTIDSGLTGLGLDANGNLNTKAGKGVDGFAGVYGSKRLRRGTFGINYQGHYRQYSGGRNMSGTDQVLSLYTSRQLSKRSMIALNVGATTTNRPFGFSLAGTSLDPTTTALYSPTGEIFDNRIYFGSAGAEYIVQKSARLSFGLNGSGFITRRTGGILFGVNGATASANVAYRLSRRQTVSAGYQFFTYNFTRNFGDSFANGAFAGYSTQLGRRTEFGIQLGFFRLESLGLRRADVDPVIAALIGTYTVNEVFYSTSILPTGSVSISHKASRYHSLGVQAGVSASPGNGIVNTSRSTNAGGSYTYSGIRSLGLSAGVNYSRLGSLIAGNQIFEIVQANGNASRKITEHLFLSATAGNRRFLGTNTGAFRRSSYFATLGITWSPNQIPISIR